MRKRILFVLLLSIPFFNNKTIAQSISYETISKELLDKKIQERIKLSDFNYMDYNYKYLDTKYNIHIDSASFNKFVTTYGYYKERIKSYRDSLYVITHGEFQNADMARIAVLELDYSWERLGYYTWMTPKNIKEFALEFNINHPWRMKIFLINEENNNQKVIEFYQSLHQKFKIKYPDVKYVNGREDFLTQCFRMNPYKINNNKCCSSKKERCTCLK